MRSRGGILRAMSQARSYRPQGSGPFRVEHLRPGDPYELSDGHAIVAEPAGRRHGRRNLSAGTLIDTDPAVEAAGVDVGYALDERTLRAPDVSVGNLDDREGFAVGAPLLAVEYVERGRDLAEVARKAEELLAGGTRLVWVVHLGGPWRVEVHEAGRGCVVKGAGEVLEAPGILRNAIPVDALYDREAAHEVALRNLLQRHGYADLDAFRAAGRAAGGVERRSKGRAEDRAQGYAEGQHVGALEMARALLRQTLARHGLHTTARQEAAIDACENLDQLVRWHERALTASSVAEALRRG